MVGAWHRFRTAAAEAAGRGIAAALAAVATLPSAHGATTITVNLAGDTVANDGRCSLREAITAANTDTPSGAAAGECPPAAALTAL